MVALASEKRFFMGIMVLGIAYYYRSTYSQRLDGPVVNTKYGQLKGVRSQSRQGRPFYEFLGIPFARAPIKDLRFEPPVPPQPWEGDCLYLNVFSPKIPNLENDSGIPDAGYDDGKLLPVMVYIHGGLFINGGSDLWRPTYFMDEDVIIVSINYRLGALGFLSTGDGTIRGNMALKDQVIALRWIQNNIHFFGGDSSRCTIFGESAGGVSAHLHMLSPMSKGLFSRVLAQSGSAFHFWTINHEPRQQSLRFGKLLGCPTEDTKEMVKCLKNLEASAIVDIHREIMDPLRDHSTIFKPVIEVIDDEHTFISKHPRDIVASGNYSRVECILGINSDEGLITAAAVMANKTMTDLAQNEWNEFVRKLLVFQKNDDAAQKIRDFYFENKSDITTFDNLHSYAKMISDRGFFADIHHGAKLQAKSSPVYLYYYSYPGEWTVANLFMEVRGTLPRLMEAGWAILSSCNSWLHNWINKTLLGRTLPNYGASHSDELALLFQMPWISDVFEDSRDYTMSLDLVKLWVSFAKQMDGQHRMDLQFRNATWNLANFSNGTLIYLNIDAKPKMIEEPFTKRIEFWDSLHLIDA
ncbi:Venom carboxylesterase-6 [Orchesella cincta]|uniref:Venom carboxylesterase-6 n=1 Tax=Orchesella cincta TaxID=48709 RepID=A0A1D2N5A5_ORCCI|nr:Venom carboxylesterase-6 [Orchesella cincta]